MPAPWNCRSTTTIRWSTTTRSSGRCSAFRPIEARLRCPSEDMPPGERGEFPLFRTERLEVARSDDAPLFQHVHFLRITDRAEPLGAHSAAHFQSDDACCHHRLCSFSP